MESGRPTCHISGMKPRTYIVRPTITWEVIELSPTGREQVAITGLNSEAEALAELKKFDTEEHGGDSDPLGRKPKK